MAETEKPELAKRKWNNQRNGGPGIVYFLGFIGALIYFLQQADTFWQGVLGVLEAFVWPVLLIYHALQIMNV